jgi:hypothetical protein
MNRFLFAKQAEDRAPSGCGPQARWLCCSLLTYRTGYASSLAPRERSWGPAAECELISARTLRLIAGIILNMIIFGGLLFVPAGTLEWWRAGVFLGVIVVAAFVTMVTVFPGREDLLKER